MSVIAQGFINTVLASVASSEKPDVKTWFADGITLHTPRHHKPVTDPGHIAIILQSITKVLEGFHYSRSWATGSEAIMEFKGKIGDIAVHGLDIFSLNASGKITELTVFIRPTKAHAALAETEDRLVLAMLAKQAGSAP